MGWKILSSTPNPNSNDSQKRQKSCVLHQTEIHQNDVRLAVAAADELAEQGHRIQGILPLQPQKQGNSQAQGNRPDRRRK